jgi:phage terminase small subunit
MKKRNLTTQQKMFVSNILEGMNQTDAYLNAGYKCPRSVARRNAARLMTNADILEKIKGVQRRAAKKAEITHQMILEQYAKIAFFNIRQLYDKNGNPKKILDLDDDTTAAIAGIDILHKNTHSGEIYTIKKIRLNDKIKALDSLARIQGMFSDRLNLGMNAQTLNAILLALPEDFAASVREELGKLVSSRRG